MEAKRMCPWSTGQGRMHALLTPPAERQSSGKACSASISSHIPTQLPAAQSPLAMPCKGMLGESS